MSEELSIGQIEDSIAQAKPVIDAVRAQVGRAIVGQRRMVDRLLIGMMSNGHVLLEGVPGLAKTTAVQALAKSLSLDFKRIQFTPDLLPSDLLGTQIYNPSEGTFKVHKGPLFTNIVLADEINRAPAKVQSALLEAMQERQITLDGVAHRLPASFMVLATQNPIEQEGTYPLPEAQSDRFLLKVKISYPDRDEEHEILRLVSGGGLAPEPVATEADLDRCRLAARQVRMEPVVESYVVDLVRATRDPASVGLAELDRIIDFGASPRATLALATTARSHAVLVEGRPYVTPDDVKAMAHDVLRHRILLSYEAEADGLTVDDVITRVIEQVRTP
jgi:MoxR-like ATPase